MTKPMKQSLTAVAVALWVSGVSVASAEVHDGNLCSLRTLNGLYLFSATGYNIVTGVAQPKAIVEFIRFNGDGTLHVPAASRSVNGAVGQSPPGDGIYTLSSTETDNSACTGTLNFTNGPSFDLFTAGKGEDVWMIQNNANTVLQGSVTKVAR